MKRFAIAAMTLAVATPPAATAFGSTGVGGCEHTRPIRPSSLRLGDAVARYVLGHALRPWHGDAGR